MPFASLSADVVVLLSVLLTSVVQLASTPTSQPASSHRPNGWLTVYEVITNTPRGVPDRIRYEMTIRGKKSRIDVGKQMSVITDAVSGDEILIDHPNRSWTRIAGNSVKQAAAGAILPPIPKASDLKPAGKAVLRDHEVNVYRFDGASGSMVFWVDEAYPGGQEFMTDFAAAIPEAISGVQPAAPLAGVPIRIERSPSSGSKTVQDLISVARVSVQDATFEVPGGYKEVPKRP